MKTRKHKLEYKEDFDFLLLGLASNENDYRLIWRINNVFNYSFERSDNLRVVISNSEEMEFSHYTYDDENTFLYYRIMSNKCDKGVLIEELKNIDYLLIIQGDFSESFVTGFVSKMKKIENIHGVFRISPANLKNKERLLI